MGAGAIRTFTTATNRGAATDGTAPSWMPNGKGVKLRATVIVALVVTEVTAGVGVVTAHVIPAATVSAEAAVKPLAVIVVVVPSTIRVNEDER